MLGLAFACLGCAAKARLVRSADVPRAELIRSLKDFERETGFEETDNFSQSSSRDYIDYRCYYTGKLKLPSDYYQLKLRRGTPRGCPVDDAKYDVFFYRVEAVASGHTPITPSLGKASVERTLVVVPHEDFHNDSRIEGWPTAIREAASTLVGFLAAAAFAKKEYGESSPEYLRLSREPGIFLRKAEIVNRHAARLAELYRKSRDGQVARPRALEQKKALFGLLRGECAALPDARSFNKHLSALNNAGLAFDLTYTRHYPLLYRVSRAAGGFFPSQLDQTIAALRPPSGRKSFSEEEAVAYFRRQVKNEQASGPDRAAYSRSGR